MKEFKTPKNIQICFVLKYRSLEIGFLKLQNGKWSFKYSEDFKNQNEIAVLRDFPNNTL